jgi:hypothetical protein
MMPRLMDKSARVGHWIGNPENPAPFLIEGATGRVRPLAWAIFWVHYRLAGADYQTHHVLRFLWLGVALAGLFIAGLSLSQHTLGGAASVLVFLLFAPGLENAYRLAPQEIPLSAFISLSIGSLALFCRLCEQNRVSAVRTIMLGLAIISLGLAFATKESSLSLLGFGPTLSLASLLLLPDARTLRSWQRRTALYAGFTVTFGLALGGAIWFTGAFGHGDSSLWGEGGILIALRNMLWYLWVLLRNYSVILIAGLISFGVRVVRRWRARRCLDIAEAWQVSCLSFVLMGLLFQSPYRAAVERYLHPFVIGLALFLGIEVVYVVQLYRKSGPLRRSALALLAALGSFLVIWEAFATGSTIYQNVYQRDLSSYEVTRFLAVEAEPGARIWVNLPKTGEIDAEFAHGMARVFKAVWERSDITVKPLDEAELTNCCKGDWVALWTHAAAIDPTLVRTRLGERATLRAEFLHSAKRIWSPGTLLERSLLAGPLGLPHRAPQDVYLYNWQVLRVER